MITEQRYQELMKTIDMSNLLQVLKQCAIEAAFAEREECAKICDNNAYDYTREGAEVCAAEIRGRS